MKIELFTSVQEAKLLAKQHCVEYKTYRPQRPLRFSSKGTRLE
jgi:hypothetical protein